MLTLLARLIEGGYLHSEKAGKERIYSPRISYEEYLRSETKSFFSKFHEKSVRSLVSTLYDGEQLSDRDIADLRDWLNERGGVSE